MSTYDIGNPGSGMGQAPKCGSVKAVNGIPNLSLLLLTGSQTAIYIYTYK